MALDAVPGSPTANSYCTIAQATVFLAERLQPDAWYQELVTTEGYASLAHMREASLIWATRLMDEQARWHGEPATTTQALAWPQTGQTDSLGRPVPETVIPAAIQRATALYALALLEETSAASRGVVTSAVKSRKVGDLQITYHDPQQTSRTATRAASETMPADVRALLRPYAQLSGGMTIPLLRT